MRNKDIVLQFIENINAQKMDSIIELMSENHQFIDAEGNIEDKTSMISGWKGYFEWFPDYLIEVDEIMSTETTFGIFGHTSGSYRNQADKYWKLPASWRVVVENKKISIWQVYCDTKIPYETMS